VSGRRPRPSPAGETGLRPRPARLQGHRGPAAGLRAHRRRGSVEGGRALTTRIRQAGEEFVSLTSTIIGSGRDDLAEVTGVPDAESGAADAGAGSPAAGPSADRGRGGESEFDPEHITPFAQLLEGRS